jgi:hypothetical protein
MGNISNCCWPFIKSRNQSRRERLVAGKTARWRSILDDDDWDDQETPPTWEDLIDEESFDPEPLDDAALEDFEFEEIPDELECPPEEMWDDADEG